MGEQSNVDNVSEPTSDKSDPYLRPGPVICFSLDVPYKILCARKAYPGSRDFSPRTFWENFQFFPLNKGI